MMDERIQRLKVLAQANPDDHLLVDHYNRLLVRIVGEPQPLRCSNCPELLLLGMPDFHDGELVVPIICKNLLIPLANVKCADQPNPRPRDWLIYIWDHIRLNVDIAIYDPGNHTPLETAYSICIYDKLREKRGFLRDPLLNYLRENTDEA